VHAMGQLGGIGSHRRSPHPVRMGRSRAVIAAPQDLLCLDQQAQNREHNETGDSAPKQDLEAVDSARPSVVGDGVRWLDPGQLVRDACDVALPKGRQWNP
jgi:hypothetical protein